MERGKGHTGRGGGGKGLGDDNDDDAYSILTWNVQL